MNEALAQTLAALELAVRLSLPTLGAALAVSLVIGLLQAWSRVSDGALSALPRALISLLVLGSVGGWMAHELVSYASAVYRSLPELVR